MAFRSATSREPLRVRVRSTVTLFYDGDVSSRSQLQSQITSLLMLLRPSNAAGCIAVCCPWLHVSSTETIIFIIQGNRMLLNLRGHHTHTEIELSGYLSFGPELPRIMDDRSVLTTITNFGVSTTRTNGGRLSTSTSSILSADRGRASVTLDHGWAI